MTSKNNGGPAFPIAAGPIDHYGNLLNYPEFGMSLRDWFAGQALPAIIKEQSNSQGHGDPTFWLNVSIHAYRAADAMLAERAKGSE